jgi:hypothetical protein
MKPSKLFIGAGAALLAVAGMSTWADPPVVTIPYQAPAVPAQSGKHTPPVVTIPHDAPRVIVFPKPVPAAITSLQPPAPLVAVAAPAPQPAAKLTPPSSLVPDARMAAAVASAVAQGAGDSLAAAAARAASVVEPPQNDVAHAQPAPIIAPAMTVASAAPSPIAAGGSVPAEMPAAGTAVPPTGPSAATLAAPPPVDLAAERLLDQDAAMEARSKLEAIAHVTGKSLDQEQRRQHAMQLLHEHQGRLALAEVSALSSELGTELSRKYRVAAGEDLRTIAGKPDVYGNAELWPLLLRANDLDRPDSISAGTELDVPLHPSPGQVVSALAYAHEHGTW